MHVDEMPFSERIASSFSQLSLAAKDLNSVSDELGRSIAEIDFALKKMNLGEVVWLRIRGGDGHPLESWYWSEHIGYDKIGTTWGISLRRFDGDVQEGEEVQTEETWLFSNAPHKMRISAIDKIPDLIEKISKEAINITNELRAKLSEAKAVADAMNAAAISLNIPSQSPAPES